MRPLGRLPRRPPALASSSLINPTRRTAAAPSVRRASSSHHESDGDYGDDVYTKESAHMACLSMHGTASSRCSSGTAFTTKPFVWTAGAIALWYGVYKASLENSPAFANDPASIAQPGSVDLVEEAEDERRPWLTRSARPGSSYRPCSMLTKARSRYMAYHFAPQTELYKKRNADNYDVIVAEASNKLFVNTAQLPSLRRYRTYKWVVLARLRSLVLQLTLWPVRSSFDDASSFNHVPGTVTDYSDLRIKTYEDDRTMPEKQEGGDDGEGKEDDE